MIRAEDAVAGLARELEAFLALLEEEAMALSSGNPDRLSELVGERQGITLRIAEQWQALAGALGMPPRSEFATLRDKALAGALPAQAWRRLEKLTHEAARLNQVNGRLIEEQMRRNQAAMQILQQAAAGRGLYGADGRVTDFLHVNRSIDTA
jgi:flagellar biosynthesis protein FlgN